MNSEMNSATEQAIQYFHRHRDIYVLKSDGYSKEQMSAFEAEFEDWISNPDNQRAYADVSDTWSATDLLDSISEEELKNRGIELNVEKEEIKKKVKVLAALALLDLLLALIFPPLSVLEPILLIALIYYGVRYAKAPKLFEGKLRSK